MFPAASILAKPANGEVLHRLVRGDLPCTADFCSHRDRPRRRPVAPGTPWLFVVGVSMFDTHAGALQVARLRPACVAQVRLVADIGIHLASTGSRGHRTVWGDPDLLVDCVTSCRVAP